MGCKTCFGPWCCWWRCTVCCFFCSFGIGRFAVLFGVWHHVSVIGERLWPTSFARLISVLALVFNLINLNGLAILQCQMFSMPGYAITASGAWNNKTAVSCDPQINFEFCEWEHLLGLPEARAQVDAFRRLHFSWLLGAPHMDHVTLEFQVNGLEWRFKMVALAGKKIWEKF